MIFERQEGVPKFEAIEMAPKRRDYAILIPVINEGGRIQKELKRSKKAGVSAYADIIICDGGSSDGSTGEGCLSALGVNTLLIKKDGGRQGAQLRMGFWWAIQRGYRGIITIDGNNKDSIEDVPEFIGKLIKGYDFIQGSRFIKGGRAVNTPFIRKAAIRLIHAPIISLTAGRRFTDTTNAFRAYSVQYLRDDRVGLFRDAFSGYELLAYLSVRAGQLGYRTCEIPVTRAYPKKGKVPTKISFFKGNMNLFLILFRNAFGRYVPEGVKSSGALLDSLVRKYRMVRRL